MRLSMMLLAALALSAQDRQIGKGINFYSLEKEAALGAQLAREFRQRTTPLDSPAAKDFLERMGRRIAAQMPVAGRPYTFAIVADDVNPTHEPVSLPGGYIFVPAGLILTAQSEDECAGMLAHAMAHVAARHATRQATRNQLIVAGSKGGWPPVPGGGADVGLLSFPRSFETEADAVAVKTASDAGYNPMALARYIGRVQPETIAAPFSALPPRASRVAYLENMVLKLPAKSYSSDDGFPRIQNEVRRL